MIKRLLTIPKKRLLKKILGYDEIYSVAIRKRKDFSDSLNNSDYGFKLVKNNDKQWCADPLLYEAENRQYLFVEEYDRDICRGHISVAEIMDNNQIKYYPVIKENFHMSFPMVFDWHGKKYMVPETSEDSSIRVYLAVKFPYEWKCIKRIQTEEKYVDTVLIEKHKDCLEFLTSAIKEDNPLETRFQKFSLQISDTDVVVSWDVEFNENKVFNRFDRNAGNIFTKNGKRFLPTQFSSNIDYGVGLCLRDLSNLTDYEKNVMDINNTKITGIKKENIIGIHTYSMGDDIDIIDVRYLCFSPLYQYKKLFRRH